MVISKSVQKEKKRFQSILRKKGNSKLASNNVLLLGCN